MAFKLWLLWSVNSYFHSLQTLMHLVAKHKVFELTFKSYVHLWILHRLSSYLVILVL